MPTHKHHADRTQVSFWLHHGLLTAVRQEARKRGWPVSAVLRHGAALASGYSAAQARAAAEPEAADAHRRASAAPARKRRSPQAASSGVAVEGVRRLLTKRSLL